MVLFAVSARCRNIWSGPVKIEKNDLISVYFRRQVEAQRNLRPE
jgi:hypothetical protein